MLLRAMLRSFFFPLLKAGPGLAKEQLHPPMSYAHVFIVAYEGNWCSRMVAAGAGSVVFKGKWLGSGERLESLCFLELLKRRRILYEHELGNLFWQRYEL